MAYSDAFEDFLDRMIDGDEDLSPRGEAYQDFDDYLEEQDYIDAAEWES